MWVMVTKTGSAAHHQMWVMVSKTGPVTHRQMSERVWGLPAAPVEVSFLGPRDHVLVASVFKEGEARTRRPTTSDGAFYIQARRSSLTKRSL